MIPSYLICWQFYPGKPRASGDDPSVKVNGISLLE